jgi:hypothetical protein
LRRNKKLFTEIQNPNRFKPCSQNIIRRNNENEKQKTQIQGADPGVENINEKNKPSQSRAE